MIFNDRAGYIGCQEDACKFSFEAPESKDILLEVLRHAKEQNHTKYYYYYGMNLTINQKDLNNKEITTISGEY